MNRLFFILLLVCISLKSFSWEVKSDSTIFLGVKGSYRFSKIIGYPGEINYLIRPEAGVVFTYNMHRELSLKSGLMLVNNGFSFESVFYDMIDTIGIYKVYSEFSYMGIPLDFSYNFGRKKFNVFISAGMEFNFLLKQRSHANLPAENNGIPVEPYNVDNIDLYKSFDFGFSLGTGCEYKIKPNIVIFAEAKYHCGIRNFLNNNPSYTFKHRSYSTSIGIRFGIPLIYRTY
jgi:opacity protein-like surface antigen